MEPQNINFGGGVVASVFSPAVLAVTLIAGLLILFLPKKKAFIPFLVVGTLIPINQILVLSGLHFPMFRVLMLFAFGRMAWAKISGKDKIFSGGMNGIDWAVIVLTVSTAIDGALLWQESAEVVFQAGHMVDVFGAYFLARYLIRDEEDIRRVLKAMVFVVLFMVPIMVLEHILGRNPYYELLGGAHLEMFSSVEDRVSTLRARGCFAHPIIAGTFGGFMMPLFAGWWKQEKRDRKYAALGLLGAAAIPFLVGSSTALFALIAAIGALCLWPMRRHLWLIRWGAVGILVAGQLYMTSPVWHLISDVSLSADSSSYHRYQLVNQCIIHFWDWALIGTKEYASWGWDMWDLSNQYVGTADTAGLIPLLALLAILVFGFKYIGRTRQHFEGDRQREFFVWAVGASLFANAVAFFGIQYWDQVIVAWYALLGMIGAVTLVARHPQEAWAPAAETAPAQMGTKMGRAVTTLPATGLARPGRALSGHGAQATVRDTPGKNWMLPTRYWPRRNG